MQEKPRPPNAAVGLSTPPVALSQGASQGTGAGRRYVSEQLLGNHTEVEIQHGESIYRLRLTSLGKLILTK